MQEEDDAQDVEIHAVASYELKNLVERIAIKKQWLRGMLETEDAVEWNENE